MYQANRGRATEITYTVSAIAILFAACFGTLFDYTISLHAAAITAVGIMLFVNGVAFAALERDEKHANNEDV